MSSFVIMSPLLSHPYNYASLLSLSPPRIMGLELAPFGGFYDVSAMSFCQYLCKFFSAAFLFSELGILVFLEDVCFSGFFFDAGIGPVVQTFLPYDPLSFLNDFPFLFYGLREMFSLRGIVFSYKPIYSHLVCRAQPDVLPLSVRRKPSHDIIYYSSREKRELFSFLTSLIPFFHSMPHLTLFPFCISGLMLQPFLRLYDTVRGFQFDGCLPRRRPRFF